MATEQRSLGPWAVGGEFRSRRDEVDRPRRIVQAIPVVVHSDKVGEVFEEPPTNHTPVFVANAVVRSFVAFVASSPPLPDDTGCQGRRVLFGEWHEVRIEEKVGVAGHVPDWSG